MVASADANVERGQETGEWHHLQDILKMTKNYMNELSVPEIYYQLNACSLTWSICQKLDEYFLSYG